MIKVNLKRASFGALVAFTMSIGGGAIASAQQLKLLSVAQGSLSMNFVPLYVAEHAGFLRDEGLKVDATLAGGGPKAMAALISGSVDVALAILSDGLSVHRKGLKVVKAFAALLNGYPAGITLRTDVAKKVGVDISGSLAQRAASLKGVKIGITTPGSFPIFWCVRSRSVMGWSLIAIWSLFLSVAWTLWQRRFAAGGSMPVFACRP